LRLLGLPCGRAPQLPSLSHVDHAGLASLAEPVRATRAGANKNAEPFSHIVPPHVRDQHAQTTRQERQKKAAARGGFKCVWLTYCGGALPRGRFDVSNSPEVPHCAVCP